MQIVFPPATISDNPVRPFSSAPVYNQTIPVVMARRPYVNKLRFLPCPEKAATLAITDVRDQIQSGCRAALFPQLPRNEPNASAPKPIALSFIKCRRVCMRLTACSASLIIADYVILFVSCLSFSSTLHPDSILHSQPLSTLLFQHCCHHSFRPSSRRFCLHHY